MADDNFGSFLGSSGGGSIVGGVIGAVGNVIQAERQYKRQKELMRMQQEYQTSERESTQQWQEHMWNVTNQYESPQAVMSRLRAAGLSPDLYYKGSSDFTAASMPVGQPSQAPNISQPAGETSSVAAMEKLSSLALSAAQTRKTSNEATHEETKNRYTNALITHEGEKISLTRTQQRWSEKDIERISSDIQTAGATRDKLNTEIENLSKSGKILDVQFEELSRSLEDRLLGYMYDNKERMSRIGLNDTQIRELPKLYAAQCAAYMADVAIKTTQNEIDKIDYERIKRTFDAELEYGRSTFRNENYIFKRAVTLEQAMLETNYSLFRQQFENYDDYSVAQIWVDMITQVIGSFFSGVSTISTVNSANASADLKKQIRRNISE